ncbi:ribosome small subunit-dependent GTPase A [Carboxylicivirga caseinilyticus]|uniref:ribosome small subunit-dependent GTPase A n=1 Tax=Carboxylicivirga caseinilyticus TaxID=3417572 RepID=UPI003D35259F|nr:ribosome small subunit-dependent GTPase A [Marinilabiliaceae bacterium A049]
MSILHKYGLNKYASQHEIPPLIETGRVISVHKTNYRIITETGISLAELNGHLLFTLPAHELPQTGDWVRILTYNESHIITQILSRTTTLLRKSPGKTSDVQVLAANVDTALIIQGLDRDFNINRLERMCVSLQDSQIEPIIILNKIDLDKDWKSKVANVRSRLPNLMLIPISAITNENLELLHSILKPEITYVMIGSSGVGKSTLLNALIKKDIQETKSISSSVGKGRHTTTSRDLFLLDNGSILIDSPGVREFGLAIENIESISLSFDDINSIGTSCHFIDCTHTTEPGCAILKAIKDGKINEDQYENYLKLRNEALHYQRTTIESKRLDRNLAKRIKKFKKQNPKSR